MSSYITIVGRYKCQICGKLFEKNIEKYDTYGIKQVGSVEDWINKSELWSVYPPFVHECGQQYGFCELIGFAKITG